MAKNSNQLNTNLTKFINLLTDSFNIYAVVLFGSYADKKAGQYSDIDIAVFSEDFGHKPFEEMKKLFKLRRSIDTDIEPLPFNKKTFFNYDRTDFVYEILSKGKIIYKDGKMYL